MSMISLLYAIYINKKTLKKNPSDSKVKIEWLMVAPTGQMWYCIPELFFP